jgi:hypothetical protein
MNYKLEKEDALFVYSYCKKRFLDSKLLLEVLFINTIKKEYIIYLILVTPRRYNLLKHFWVYNICKMSVRKMV